MEVIDIIVSMTGYGREMIQLENTSITIEIRSVNHRFLDIVVKMQSIELNQIIMEATEKVRKEVLKMRKTEGAYLVDELKFRLDSIYAIITKLHDKRVLVRTEYQKRITERVQDYLEKAMQLDESRIH